MEINHVYIPYTVEERVGDPENGFVCYHKAYSTLMEAEAALVELVKERYEGHPKYDEIVDFVKEYHYCDRDATDDKYDTFKADILVIE